MENWSTNEFALEAFIWIAWLNNSWRKQKYPKYFTISRVHPMAQFPIEDYLE